METGSQQQLDRYSTPVNIVNANTNNTDVNAPYSFQTWYAAHRGILPGQEYRQYNEYLVNWYKNSSTKSTTTAVQVRTNYLNLLNQLQLFLPNQVLENFYNQIDVNDEKELLLAIPYFARKLRDIALYYSQLRDKIKKTKLQYNLVGSNLGITQNILSEILGTYTQRPNSSITIPASVWNTVPTLSSIQNSITLQLEELYDFQNYLGQSPTVPASSYFNFDDSTTAAYFSSLGLTLSSDDWIYSTGNLDISADSTLFNVLGPNIGTLQNLLTQNYLGEDKYSSLTFAPSANTDFYTLNLSAGNNFFYYPAGSYVTNTYGKPVYSLTPIQSAGLDNATAGTTLQTADTIFVKTALGTQAAWYRLQTAQSGNVNMNAALNGNNTTVFRFPYPGYGLSGQDIAWTGFDITTTPGFTYLEPAYQNAIQQSYWAANATLSTITPININDTTLIDSKAFASQKYELADKIRISTSPANYTDNVFSSSLQEAWLYSMQKTDLPIAGFANPSVIVWPYQRLDTTTSYPSSLPTNLNNVCQPVQLNSISFPNAVASDSFSSADVIYKIRNYKDGAGIATEAAWLSGSGYNTTAYNTSITLTGVYQPGLNLYFQTGTNTKFVWNETNQTSTDLSTVFRTINHEPNCTYVNTLTANYKASSLCTCNSVLFSPFGHPSANFTDNNSLADFIALDTQMPATFDLNSWVGSDGLPYTKSKDFAWYKTNKDIGWGDGQWVTGSGSIFLLKPGSIYTYGRAKIDKTGDALPNLTIRKGYINSNNVWISAKKSPNGTWYSTDQVSPMVIKPGDFLRFQRPGYTSFNLYSNYTTPTTIFQSVSSIWSNYDRVSTGQPVLVSFPYNNFPNASTLNSTPGLINQYPDINALDINQYVNWTLTDPKGGTTTYLNVPSFTFVPSLTGVYKVSLSVIAGGTVSSNVTYSTVTNGATSTTTQINPIGYNISGGTSHSFGGNSSITIPGITAVNPYTTSTLLTTVISPAPGYVLNTPLYGWDYNSNSAALSYTNNKIPGARPFWAKGYNDKDAYTNYKGIISWGTPQKFVDEHNVVTQPTISPITLSGGEYFEYECNYNTTLNWKQPLALTKTFNNKTWCTLDVNTTAVATLSSLLGNINTYLVTTPLTTLSDIQLTNYVNDQPVEVYYNALTPFTWMVTAVPQLSTIQYLTPVIQQAFIPQSPWNNLDNRFYPTYTALPFLGSLSSNSQIGGYFTPNHLGVSYYVDQGYTAIPNITSTALSGIFENPLIHIGGRGLTKQDQSTPWVITEENNVWLKEPYTSGPAAGNIKKNIAKSYQKFIPYQSDYETNPHTQIGLVTPTSRQSPWGGVNDSTWTDYANYPVNFAGNTNVDIWANSEILKQTGLQLDNWATDIFGNQYGLYKNLSAVKPVDRDTVTGNIWTKKASQFVSSAGASLSGVFNAYQNTWFYNELTGTGVVKMDVFFDTLYVETTGAVFLEKLEYDYTTNTISSVTDNAHYISLATPVEASISREYSNPYNDFNSLYTNYAKTGQTWFFPQEKQVILSVCSLSGYNIFPQLYRLDINTGSFGLLFPTLSSDIHTIANLSSLSITDFDAPVLSHNAGNRTYTMSILTHDVNNNDNILEFNIADIATPTLNNVNVYYSLIS